MQCGLAFSKAGQCRIASLRKELHHKEKEDRGGGGVRAGDSERETGEEGSLQPEGSFHITVFFFYYAETRAGCLMNCRIYWTVYT